VSWERIILHADMDAFYAAVEQLDNPELRGKPVLVGGPGGRGVVSTASYEARPFGVGSAMPMARALRMCPDAIVVPPRFDRYTEISKIIMAIFADYSHTVEPLSLDEAFMDMTGAEGLFGTPRDMGQAIKAAVDEATGGLKVSIGAANTKFVAKVASDFDKPDGLTVVAPDEVREFLDPLPVSRLWGVGIKTEPRLRKQGLNRIGDVFDADPVWLTRTFGSLGRHIYRLAHNEDPRPVKSRRRAKSVSSERTLGSDVRGAEAIKPHLRKAADRVASALRKKSLLARGVRVKLKTHRFELRSRQRLLRQPTDHADTFYAVALELLPEFDLEPPMRLIGLGGYDLVKNDQLGQLDLFSNPVREEEKAIDGAMDSIRARFGDELLRRGTAVGSKETAFPRLGDNVVPPSED